MSADTRGLVPGGAQPPVAPEGVVHSDGASRKMSSRWAVVIRSVAHLAAWAPFVYAAVRAIHDGWRPVSDTALIAFRSWDVLSTHGLLVGEATRLSHGVYDPGPLEFWLLALPVHLDPVHGVLWGAALWCIVAASLAIEAAWAAAGRLGAVIASGMILGVVAWIPKIAMLPAWNPWFGMMFFLAALAAGWAVLSGRQKWWPALAVTGSVAAQAHLMYAIAVAALLVVAFIAVVFESVKSGKYRWAIIGVIVGLACWAAPLIQQFTARAGNITRLIEASRGGGGSGARAGLSFGLKALSAATQPPTYWSMRTLPPLKLGVVDHRAAWFGIAELAVTALALAVAIVVLRSRRAAALAVLSLVTSAAALETFSGIPASNLWREQTDLSYLMAPLFPLGVLAWLMTGTVIVLAIWRAAHRLRLPGAGRHLTRGAAGGAAKAGVAPWSVWFAGVAAMALIATLTVRASAHIGGALGYQKVGRKAVASATTTIEREISPRRIALVVAVAQESYLRQVTMGLAYSLRTAGFTPEIPTWAFQLGPAYYLGAGPATRVTVFVHSDGGVRVVINGS